MNKRNDNNSQAKEFNEGEYLDDDFVPKDKTTRLQVFRTHSGIDVLRVDLLSSTCKKGVHGEWIG